MYARRIVESGARPRELFRGPQPPVHRGAAAAHADASSAAARRGWRPIDGPAAGAAQRCRPAARSRRAAPARSSAAGPTRRLSTRWHATTCAPAGTRDDDRATRRGRRPRDARRRGPPCDVRRCAGGLGSGKTTVTAVDGVSFAVARRRDARDSSGSRAAARDAGRCHPAADRAHRGRVRFDGTDVTALRGARCARFRRRVQLVFQDPYACSTRGMTRGRDSARRLAQSTGIAAGRERRERGRVVELLELVGLAPEPPTRYPARVLRRTAPAHRHRPRPRAGAGRSSSPTSRSPRSTSRCRPRSSTCSRTCRTSSG